MFRNLVLLGAPGCGKGTVLKLLLRQRFAVPTGPVHGVSMSEVLNGGNPDGTLMSDDQAISKLNAHLQSLGFNRSSKKSFLFEGVGRSGFQMERWIEFLESCGQLAGTAFLKLNLPTPEAERRMLHRYHENLRNGQLRKEESPDEKITTQKIRGRIVEWCRTREAIFDALDTVNRENVFDINATQGPESVTREILSRIGWRVRPDASHATFTVGEISENDEPRGRHEGLPLVAVHKEKSALTS